MNYVFESKILSKGNNKMKIKEDIRNLFYSLNNLYSDKINLIMDPLYKYTSYKDEHKNNEDRKKEKEIFYIFKNIKNEMNPIFESIKILLKIEQILNDGEQNFKNYINSGDWDKFKKDLYNLQFSITNIYDELSNSLKKLKDIS